MTVKVEVSGVLTKRGALMTLGAEMQKKLEDEVKRAAVFTANYARSAVRSGAKNGIVYEKYKPRRTHRASAPGEAPANDTGALIETITQQPTQGGWLVGSTIKYSKWLEFGTQSMAERPFFRPALKKATKEWRERVINLVGAKKVRLEEVIK